MKNKLSILIASVVTLSAVLPQSSNAQSSGEDKREAAFKLKGGVKGGMNIANITIDNDGNVNDKRAIASYNVGFYADLALLPVFSIQPGLFLTGKGSKFTIGDEGSANYTRVTARPLYLELPVNVVVKLPLFNKVRLFFGAGPYVAMGIAGKNTVDGRLVGVSYSNDENIKFSNDGLNGNNGSAYEGNFKRFDAGFNFIGGLEISHFTLNANYGYGVVNIKPGSSNGVDNKYQNRVASIQVGFIL
ncbi:MAG TPA: outer membrane beta-barrel protein [Flavipsychrobacter sp.]|nr:outer membrane beta-barrel protein [Flavipsychrobacter sp.]